MIYRILQASFDVERQTIVEGPEVPDWRAFCDSLIPEAARSALSTNPVGNVSWDEIVDALVALLESRGYRKVEPVTVEYPYGIDLDTHPALPDDLDEAIRTHNRRVSDSPRRKPEGQT